MLLYLFATISTIGLFTPELEIVVHNLDRSGERVFLLSYPSSGNTWLRYCLEFLTQRPSLSRIGLSYFTQQPLGFAAGLTLDLTKTPIEKIHSPRELVGTVSDTDSLILLMRNPKETFARHGAKGLSRHGSKLAGKGYHLEVYFDNIALYERWNASHRLLIYYEELLSDPRKTLGTILTFLQEPSDRLDLFMHDYEKHQITAQTLHKSSRSTVNELLYHSKKISPEERCAVDAWISSRYPDYWQTYIKDRYSESLIFSILSQ